MKKILLTSILIATSLYAAPVESTAVRDQTYTNDIMNSTNKLDFQNNKEASQVGGQLLMGDDVTIFNIPMSFKVIDQVSIDLNAPIVNIKNATSFGGPDTPDYTDIGDISIAANYRYGDFKAEEGLHLATLRYKSTTGDVTRFLGTGKPSYTLAYNFAKEISEFILNAYASYTLNDKLVLGDSISLMVGGSHQSFLFEEVRTNVKLSYLDIAIEGFIPGYTQANLWLEFSSKTLVEGMHLGAGIKIPLIDDVNNFGGVTTDGTNGLMLYISTANFFSQTN